MKLLVIGGGWSGLAAAVAATRRGWQVCLCEASRTLGGRARSVTYDNQVFDNGQHVLIGAYRDTLALMRSVGVPVEKVLTRRPLDLRFMDGQGLQLPNLPPPWNALLGIATARGWRASDRWALLRTALRWQRQQFRCAPHLTVQALCQDLPERVMQDMIEPLCVSALNTSAHAASGEVFLRVMQDGLFTERGGSDLLLPRVPLGAVLPEAAHQWLLAQGAEVQLGKRITDAGLARHEMQADVLVLACPASEAARLSAPLNTTWSTLAANMPSTAITTVCLRCEDPQAHLPSKPLMALRSNDQNPAQFVGVRDGVLSFVISNSQGERDALIAQVMTQARTQLGLTRLRCVYAATEKRATFACTPQLQRPMAHVAEQVWACGDYIAGPYPATLEGAVRSGLQVVEQIAEAGQGQRL